MLRTVDDCLSHPGTARLPHLGSWSSVAGSSAAKVAASLPIAGPGRGAHREGHRPIARPRWARSWLLAGPNCIASTAWTCASASASTVFVGNGQVEAVRLTDGSQVPADVVVVGLGVTSRHRVARRLGFTFGRWCGLRRDRCGRRPATDVVAAGDVARWWHPLYERHLRTEHWDDAARQGAAAARTLLAGPDRAEAFDAVPYFWSDQYDVKLQMLGVPTDYDTVEVIEGDPNGWQFVAAYGRDGRTIAVVGTIPRSGACLSRDHQQTH